jgi:hypothetical protein
VQYEEQFYQVTCLIGAFVYVRKLLYGDNYTKRMSYLEFIK